MIDSDRKNSDFWPRVALYVTEDLKQAIQWAERQAKRKKKLVVENSNVPAVLRFVSTSRLKDVKPCYEFKTEGSVEVEKRLVCNYIAACRKIKVFSWNRHDRLHQSIVFVELLKFFK